MREYEVAPTYKDWNKVDIDEQNHKILVVKTCPRCGGSGAYILPNFVGNCFKCNGKGVLAKWVKAYTEEEFEKYMKNQKKAKERRVQKELDRQQELLDKSEENKKAVLKNIGYDDVENPMIYLVAGGNTYAIKEEIKSRGGHFTAELNWFFTKEVELPEGYKLVPIKFFDVYDWFPLTHHMGIKDDAKRIADEARASANPESKSEFVGEIKERLRDLKVTLTSVRAVSSRFGESVLFTFSQGDNIFVWFTSCPPDEEEAVVGNTYLLTGTVKDHKVYNGIKQTYLNRCKLKEFAI